MSEPRSRGKAAAFCAFTTSIGISTFPVFITALTEAPQFEFLLLFLVVFSFQAFCVLRALSSLHLAQRHTNRLDAFFYETRKGSMWLAFCSVVWVLMQVMVLYTTVILAMFSSFGSYEPVITGLVKVAGAFGTFIVLITMLLTVLAQMAAIVWMARTVGLAVWRVAEPANNADRSEELGMLGRDDGEWEEWKDGVQ